jgi:hypothetical protein
MQDWKKVFSSTQLATASMVMGILNENGIAAKVLNKQDSSFVFLGKVEVYVQEAQYDIALQVIQDLNLTSIEPE